MATGYFIDASNGTITKLDIKPHGASVAQIHELLDDYMEAAYMWSATGDVLYVGENGMMLKPHEGFVLLPERVDQWLHGNGVLVGKELANPITEAWSHASCSMTLDQLSDKISFWVHR